MWFSVKRPEMLTAVDSPIRHLAAIKIAGTPIPRGEPQLLTVPDSQVGDEGAASPVVLSNYRM
jgi:hypothetical protein